MLVFRALEPGNGTAVVVAQAAIPVQPTGADGWQVGKLIVGKAIPIVVTYPIRLADMSIVQG